MTHETRKAWRYWGTLLLGYILMMVGCFCPPLGVINNSVLVGAGMLIALAGLAVGVDIEGIIHELRMMKNNIVEDYKEEASKTDEENGR